MLDVAQNIQTAMDLQKQGKFAEAEALYIQILQSDSNNVPALINLGLIQQGQGKLDEATQYYKYAFSLEPNNVSLVYLLAKITQEINRLDESIHYWQTLTQLKPAGALEYYGNIGNCFVQQGKFAEGLQYFRKALDIEPKSFAAYQAIGNLFIRENKLLEAKNAFLEALKINPNYYAAKVWVTLVDKLMKGDNLISFTYQGMPFKFEITGKNLAVDIANVGGTFYEIAELEFIRDNLANKNITVVDAGANTGNHTVYFGKVLNVSKVIPIEFHPMMIGQLRKHILLNQVVNADLSKLGVALGKTRSKAAIVEHPAQDFCLTEVTPINDNHLSSASVVDMFTLDELITEPVGLLKLDVQGLEIDVLQGAMRILTTDKPDVFIEVSKENIKGFNQFLASVNYRILKYFDHGRFVNFYIRAN